MSLKVKLIVVICLLQLLCCTHVELIAVLSRSYLFTIPLWCFRNSFWLSSLWCCLGQLCPCLMSRDPLLGLRTEMWHRGQFLWFILSKGRLKSWFDGCFVNKIWWECGNFLLQRNVLLLRCTDLLRAVFRSLLKIRGWMYLCCQLSHVVVQAGGMAVDYLQNLRFHDK